MKNYIQKGDTVTFTASNVVMSGEGVLQGTLFGVAATDAGTGDEFEANLVGVYALPKADGEGSAAVGDAAYWSDELKRVTSDDTGAKRIGAIIKAASGDDEFVRVRLNGVA